MHLKEVQATAAKALDKARRIPSLFEVDSQVRSAGMSLVAMHRQALALLVSSIEAVKYSSEGRDAAFHAHVGMRAVEWVTHLRPMADLSKPSGVAEQERRDAIMEELAGRIDSETWVPNGDPDVEREVVKLVSDKPTAEALVRDWRDAIESAWECPMAKSADPSVSPRDFLVLAEDLL